MGHKSNMAFLIEHVKKHETQKAPDVGMRGIKGKAKNKRIYFSYHAYWTKTRCEYKARGLPQEDEPTVQTRIVCPSSAAWKRTGYVAKFKNKQRE
jgi:hypothetical protein